MEKRKNNEGVDSPAKKLRKDISEKDFWEAEKTESVSHFFAKAVSTSESLGKEETMLKFDDSEKPIPSYLIQAVKDLQELQEKKDNLESEYNVKINKLHDELDERSVDALKSDELSEIEAAFEEQNDELKRKLEEGLKPLFEGRKKILNDWPNKPTAQQPGKAHLRSVKIPAFWAICINRDVVGEEALREHDLDALFYVSDISYKDLNEEDINKLRSTKLKGKLPEDLSHEPLGYHLIFHFDENPYFSDKTLEWTYILFQLKNEQEASANEEEEEDIIAFGSKIQWKDSSVRLVNELKKNVEAGDSFFSLFEMDFSSTDGTEPNEQLIGIANRLRDEIIPNAILFYLGLTPNFDEEDDEEDDEDKQGSDSYEEEGGEGDDDDEGEGEGEEDDDGEDA